MAQPLAEKLRPTKIADFIGQEPLVGKDGIIRKLLRSAKKTSFFPSIIFWGPPGSGKTTLARIIANSLNRPFFEFSAVNTSIKDIEEIIEKSKSPASDQNQMSLVKMAPKKTSTPVIFIDEIHRFNKAQQDKLLPSVEKGELVLIGATTENPSFEVIGPLMSRSRVLVLGQHSEKDLTEIVKRGEQELKVSLETKAKAFLIESSNGDARVLLTVLEIAASLFFPQVHPGGVLKIRDIEQALQRRQLSFDRQGDEYYNTISAFIKSMRAGSPDAALYYLARMVEAGQDPLYIARRMVVFASEDIGMAQPTALVIANEVFRACETIGYPECQENLAHGAVYLATAKKDRSAYNAYMNALSDVKKYGNLPIPKKILNAPTKLMQDLKYGEGYVPDKYKLTNKDLLPEKLKAKKYYKAKSQAAIAN